MLGALRDNLDRDNLTGTTTLRDGERETAEELYGLN
jgi:hypothetical protein